MEDDNNKVLCENEEIRMPLMLLVLLAQVISAVWRKVEKGELENKCAGIKNIVAFRSHC